jgi:predicted DNA-binding transcriptional regulator AlpA
VAVEPEDLLDAGEVAELLGLSGRTTVAAYRSKYDDFPAPLIVKSSGKCMLWLRSDVERWGAGHRRQRGRVPGES